MTQVNDAVVPVLDGRRSRPTVEIARGVCRLLWTLGFVTVGELSLPNGRRADVVGLSAKGDIWIVEIKSCVADFRADHKWREYADYCDRLLFAVDPSFPNELIPQEVGLIVADRHGGAILRDTVGHRLASARRKAIALLFARAAAGRLMLAADPEIAMERMIE
ncbi:MAG TPA: MmcB family DNA repair protein [Hyphomicrobiaceae bacterium]|nr:MmcB family DNA repair protein [Hyphomicrobiaceae bacterium]